MNQNTLPGVKAAVQVLSCRFPSLFEIEVGNTDVQDRQMQPHHAQPAHLALQMLDRQQAKLMVFDQRNHHGGTPGMDSFDIAAQVAIPICR